MDAEGNALVREAAAAAMRRRFGKPKGSSVDLWALTQFLDVDVGMIAAALAVERAEVSRWLWGVRPLPRRRQSEIRALLLAALEGGRQALAQGRGDYSDPANRAGLRLARQTVEELEKLVVDATAAPSPGDR